MPKATDLPEDSKTVICRNALRTIDASFNDDCKRLTAAIKPDSRDSLSVAMCVVLASILVVGLNPNYANAYDHRGAPYGDEKDYDKATTDYIQAIRLNPNYADAFNYDKAISDYSEYIKLRPNDLEGYNNRGVAYGNKKDYDKAISDYTEAIRLNPNYANAYYNRGVACSNKRDYDKAISDFSEYIKVSPNEGDGYYWRGISYRRLGKNVEAQADFNKAKELGYTGPQ
jgi:tetratricopeptide (TPR) repeat protein